MNQRKNQVTANEIRANESAAYATRDAQLTKTITALKNGIDLTPYKRVRTVYRSCSALAAFQAAAPKAQSDALRQSL